MAPPAARRAAAFALRSLAASRRAARAVSSPRRSRSTPFHAHTRFAATACISTASPAAARAFLSCTARPAAARSSAPPRTAFPSTGTPASNRWRFGAPRFYSAARSALKVRLHRFKAPRRMFSTHNIPPEVQAQLNRIEAEGLLRHRVLEEKLQVLGKKVVDSAVNNSRLRIQSKWNMGKTAIGVCTTVLLGAALSGSVILEFLQSGWGKAHTESAGKLVEAEMAKLRVDVDTKIAKAIDHKDEEEDSMREEKNRALDAREAAIAAREAAMAAKEADALKLKAAEKK